MSEIGPIIDTHAHLTDPRLAEKIPDLLSDARAAGLVNVLAIGTTAADSAQGVELAASHPGVFSAVGIQPNYVAEAGPGDWERIVDLAIRARVVAIGETGLDRHWDHTPFDLQQDSFARHLDLAERLRRPVVIHCRDCERDIVAQLESLGRPVAGVLHSFTGTPADAEAFLSLGLHISFAGMLTFTSKKLDPLREAARRVPLDRLLVETDSPYLSPHPFRGKPNQPARLVLTATALAQARGITPEELAHATTANARQFFRIPVEDVLS